NSVPTRSEGDIRGAQRSKNWPPRLSESSTCAGSGSDVKYLGRFSDYFLKGENGGAAGYLRLIPEFRFSQFWFGKPLEAREIYEGRLADLSQLLAADLAVFMNVPLAAGAVIRSPRREQ